MEHGTEGFGFGRLGTRGQTVSTSPFAPFSMIVVFTIDLRARIMSIPEPSKSNIAPRFYRAAWGTREGTVLFMNASHAWFLDLEVCRSFQIVRSVWQLTHAQSTESRSTYTEYNRLVFHNITVHVFGKSCRRT